MTDIKTFEQFTTEASFYEPGDRGFVEADFIGLNALRIGLDFKNEYRINIDKPDLDPEVLMRGTPTRGAVSRKINGRQQALGVGMLYYIRSTGDLVIKAPQDGNFVSAKDVGEGFLQNMHDSILREDGFAERVDRVELSAED